MSVSQVLKSVRTKGVWPQQLKQDNLKDRVLPFFALGASLYLVYRVMRV